MFRHSTHAGKKNLKDKIKSVAAATVIGAVLAGGSIVGTSMPAHAATTGPGIGSPRADGSGWVGAWDVNGVLTLCIEVGAPSPLGAQTDGGWHGTIPAYNLSGWSGSLTWTVNQPALSGNDVGVINVLAGSLSRTDGYRNAVLQVAAWLVRGGTGNPDQLINQKIQDAGGSPAQVRQDAQNEIAAARNAVAAGGSTTAPAAIPQPALVSGKNDPWHGYIDLPAGYDSFTLNNAVFDATGTATLTAPGGGRVTWTGTPPEGLKEYTVTINGTYNRAVWENRIRLFPAATPLQQLLVAGEPTRVQGSNSNYNYDPFPLVFKPAAETNVVNVFIEKGQQLCDVIRPTVRGDVPHLRNILGQWVPVPHHLRAYGPLLSEPIFNQAGPPPGTPFFDELKFVTRTDSDPTLTDYRECFSKPVEETGYYTITDTITRAEASPAAQTMIDPDDGDFYSGYGIKAETSIVPTRIEGESQVSKITAELFEEVTDSFRMVLLDGGWLRDSNGDRIPLNLRRDSYYVPGVTSADQIGIHDTVPAGTELYDTELISGVTDLNEAKSAFRMPVKPEGCVVNVWRIQDSDQGQYAGFFTPFSDKFGLPSETTCLEPFSAHTVAEAQAPVHGTVKDLFITENDLPAEVKAELTWEVSQIPVDGHAKIDAEGNPLVTATGEVERFTSDEVQTREYCQINPLFTTEDNPITVEKAGTYPGSEFTSRTPAAIQWVGVLTVADPRDGKREVLWRDDCRNPAEQSRFDNPVITTEARQDVWAGDPLIDAAIASGILTGIQYDIGFDLYRVPKDTIELAQACVPENKVWSLDQPIRVDRDGRYEFTEEKAHIAEAGWTYMFTHTGTHVETGDVISTGECGIASETVKDVKARPEPPAEPLAMTGAAGTPVIWVAVSLLLLGGGGIALAAVRRRNTI
ncbi:hypothetical protein [Lysinibacter sp. HNR]|uniref:hypothetical protein n=1 Tax=Lysinibacter sp. HNR TaxID=3031408 RepID=UPI0024356061|nr:hypothetical protein [Lysinibacter sp. HNR]WGD37583.1 hypothetical protein FrondiHNR_01265 [Lysinibacter sp. HNR]